MKIKVCGMCDSENIQELIQLSPDYVGFIFYDKSKRYVKSFPSVNIPKETKKVGVFVNESVDNILDNISMNQLEAVQLHGDESSEYVKELQCHLGRGRKVSMIEIIKAFSVDEHFDFGRTTAYESSCDLFIFDTKGKGYGGTGKKYDWNILKKYKGKTSFLLSGGIRPEDVDSIKEFSHEKCVGLDLNSGFEDAPGVKNIEYLNSFIKEIK